MPEVTPRRIAPAPSRSVPHDPAAPAAVREPGDVYVAPPVRPDPLRETGESIGVDAAVKNALALRRRANSGLPVTTADLTTELATTGGTRTQLFLDRSYFLDALVPAIATAKDSIHLAMLTLDAGVLGQSVVDLLIAKKAEDPKIAIRLIVDRFLSGTLTPFDNEAKRNLARLSAAGIEVIENNVLTEGLEHRKLAVIDGKTAFFGGACFGDEYLTSKGYREAYAAAVEQGGDAVDRFLRLRYGDDYVDAANRGEARPAVETEACFPEWHDFGVKVEGTLVRGLQANFFETWARHGGRLDPDAPEREVKARYFSAAAVDGGRRTKLFFGVPGGDSEMRRALLRVVESAEKTLDMEFAYVLVPEFAAAIRRAADRGVKVRIITPGEHGSDRDLCYGAGRALYRDLLGSPNVEIYEFHQYTHVKLMVADGRYVFASTGNPEYFSWENGYDNTGIVDDPALARDVAARVFSPDAQPARATPITLQDLEGESTWRAIKTAVERWLMSLVFGVTERGPELSR